MRPAVAFFAAFGAISTGAFFFVGLGQYFADRNDRQELRAGAIARAVAQVAGDELAGGPSGSTQSFVEALAREVGGRPEAFVLRGMQYFAHHDPARAGARLARDSVDDKALYDRAARAKVTVKKNIEERERNPQLARDAYAEVELEELEDGRLRVFGPVKRDGELAALAEVELEPAGAPGAPPFAVLLVGLAVIGVVLGAGLRLGARMDHLGAKLAAAALLLGLLAAEGALLVSWREEMRRDFLELAADTHDQLAAAGFFGGDRGALDAAPVLALSSFGEKIPEIRAIISNDRGPRQLDPDEVPLSRRRTSTILSRAQLRTAVEADAKHLIQWAGAVALLALTGFVLGVLGSLGRAGRSLAEHRAAYLYLSPAMTGLAVLVFIPVLFGVVLGFMRRTYNVFEFAGLDNYLAILGSFDLSDPQNFYFKAGVTAMWTVVNVSLHVGIGLFLALLLNDPLLRLRGVYRVLLIVPWAIPNYITALIWRGMFHKQFGAINFFLDALGVEPIAWFQSFWPAFSANVATNVWLGFSFMMVISLGALQSIPSDLYEAARVDGAGRWQRFRHITLPLLMPALVPAVIVGTIWTFNMFNIIYLVSGGAPNGATDILITDAFRWAFERDAYGYAAAYSTLIFLILLSFSLVTNRLTGTTKGVFES